MGDSTNDFLVHFEMDVKVAPPPPAAQRRCT